MPNDTDHAIRLARLERIEAYLDAKFPEWQHYVVAPIDTPAPHPLAGLEYAYDIEGWHNPANFDVEAWLTPDDYTNFQWRDSTTHAPVPLWEVAKRLGVEHPVPADVRWTDVEFVCGELNDWPSVTSNGKTRKYWADRGPEKWGMEPAERFRLTAQYDHQPITYAQFREILGRGEKAVDADIQMELNKAGAIDPETAALLVNQAKAANPEAEIELLVRDLRARKPFLFQKPAPDFRVGDLVEVVDAKPVWPFRQGERFHVVEIIDGCCLSRNKHGLPFEQVRLISRP